MMTFTEAGAEIFVNTIEQLMQSGDGLKRWYLSAIDQLAQARQVGVSSIHGLSWCEVDDAIDLAYADKVVRTWPVQPERRAEAGESASQQPTVLPAFIEES